MRAILFGDQPIDLPRAMSLDTETTGLKWQDRMIGASMAWRSGDGEMRSCYLYSADEQQSLFSFQNGEVGLDELLLQATSGRSVYMHSHAFDYWTLYKAMRLPPLRRVLDVQHLAKCTGPYDKLSLFYLYEREIGEAPAWIKKAKEDRSDLWRKPPETQAQYARWDAEATLLLGEMLSSMPSYPDDMLERDVAFQELVMSMVERGLPTDITWLQSKQSDFEARLMGISSSLAAVGLANPGSDDQVADYLYGKLALMPYKLTEKGRGSTDMESLEELGLAANLPDEVRQVIAYRQLQKAISSWLLPLQEMASLDGRAHSQLHPFGTRSFRMASREINLQGLPMDERSNATFGTRAFGSMMGAFKAEPPDELWAIDIKQAEVRLAAMLAREAHLAQAFASGEDPYTKVARDMWGENGAKRRQDAKQAVLSSLYEVGPATYAKRYKVSEPYAQKLLEDFRARFPGIKRASRKWDRFVQHAGYVPLFTGRNRYFVAGDESWAAFNQYVQGGVAELMQAAMPAVERLAPGRLLLQIHDSLIMRLPATKNERDELIDACSKAVADALPEEIYERVRPRVPIICDGKRWQLPPEGDK